MKEDDPNFEVVTGCVKITRPLVGLVIFLVDSDYVQVPSMSSPKGLRVTGTPRTRSRVSSEREERSELHDGLWRSRMSSTSAPNSITFFDAFRNSGYGNGVTRFERSWSKTNPWWSSILLSGGSSTRPRGTPTLVFPSGTGDEVVRSSNNHRRTLRRTEVEGASQILVYDNLNPI